MRRFLLLFQQRAITLTKEQWEQCRRDVGQTDSGPWNVKSNMSGRRACAKRLQEGTDLSRTRLPMERTDRLPCDDLFAASDHVYRPTEFSRATSHLSRTEISTGFKCGAGRRSRVIDRRISVCKIMVVLITLEFASRQLNRGDTGEFTESSFKFSFDSVAAKHEGIDEGL